MILTLCLWSPPFSIAPEGCFALTQRLLPCLLLYYEVLLGATEGHFQVIPVPQPTPLASEGLIIPAEANQKLLSQGIMGPAEAYEVCHRPGTTQKQPRVVPRNTLYHDSKLYTWLLELYLNSFRMFNSSHN